MKSIGLLLFSLFKFAKFGKFLISGGTMLLSIITYSWLYGWRYGVGFIVLIFFHEMGHYIAAKQKGLNVGAPTFIPFMGAWIELKDQPHNAETEAYIAIAGPMLGTIVTFILFALTEGQKGVLMALAYAGFMINLFNLLPVTPLDGGRILGIISPKIWGVGLVGLIALFFIHPNPILILILIIAAPQVWKAYKGTYIFPSGYYDTSKEVKTKYLVQYIGLVGLLIVMTSKTHNIMISNFIS